MSEPASHNPFASPMASEAVEPEELDAYQRPRLEDLPSRWLRLTAAIIDLLILWAICIPLELLLRAILRDRSIGLDVTESLLLSNLLGLMIALLVYVIVNGQLLTKYGQSVGKYALGIKIVNFHDRQLPTFGNILLLRVFVLSLAAQVPILGIAVVLIDSLMIFTPDKRCLHDFIADTIVVKA